jgi:hypothetical protein
MNMHGVLFDKPESKAVQKLRLDSISDLDRLATIFEHGIPKPVYRGENVYSRSLKTKIERNLPEAFASNKISLERYEYQIVTEAKRRLHHYLEKVPEDGDHLSWLALLRHHGVPTRLLDVTKSLFIACFFAVREATHGVDAAIWVFNRNSCLRAYSNWCLNADSKIVRSNPFTVAEYEGDYCEPFPNKLEESPRQVTYKSLQLCPPGKHLNSLSVLHAAMLGFIDKPGIAIQEPFWISRRMDVQQGSFLIPYNVRESFENNLLRFLDLPDLDNSTDSERGVPQDEQQLRDLWAFAPVIKIRVPFTIFDALRKRLVSMNISELTMFPDIEGVFSHISALVPQDLYKSALPSAFNEPRSDKIERS